MTRAIIGIDVGGTTAKGIAIDAEGRVLARGSRATGHAQQALDGVLGLARELGSGVHRRGARLVAAGVAVPGVIDDDGSTIRFASNLAWSDLPLAALLTEALGAPTALANDATSAGLAEGRMGVARGVHDYVHIAIGTGIGACLVVDGRVLKGSGQGAGEIGHPTVMPGGDACTCGRVGCLDAYAAAAGITRRYARLAGTSRSVPEIIARTASDPVADEVWNAAIEALATAITTVTMTLDPELIVLGGGVALAGDALLIPLRTSVAAQLGWKPAPRIEASELQAMAGLAGALAVALRNLDRSHQADWSLEHLASHRERR